MRALLSQQEREVLLRVAAGHTNEAIAREMHLGVSVVKDILKSVFRKLRVDRREQAVAVATRFGAIDVGELKRYE